jgi:hypothetical protein
MGPTRTLNVSTGVMWVDMCAATETATYAATTSTEILRAGSTPECKGSRTWRMDLECGCGHTIHDTRRRPTA